MTKERLALLREQIEALGFQPQSLESWLRDRLDNCHRIATQKPDADRPGWLEDAAYFSAALNIVAAAALLDASERAELPQDWVERRLREEWWLGHGCPPHGLYGDDGEMQCNNTLQHGCVDFKRQPLDELLTVVESCRLKNIAAAMRESASPLERARARQGERLMLLARFGAHVAHDNLFDAAVNFYGEPTEGHEQPFETCPHGDCAMVRTVPSPPQDKEK